jgi:hypothetical protein
VNVPSIFRWGVLLTALLWGTSEACQICVPLPEQTLADRLLASRAVVLAREDPAQPFHYRVTEILAGAPDGRPADLFLNSQARRTLAAYPDRAMVLAQSAKDGSWSALGTTRPEYERVVREILRRADQWLPRETDNADRLDWFVPLLGHADKRLHELAYLEIGRAPYAEIRRLAGCIPAETLQAMLDDPRYLEWRSLAILMLGESGRPVDQARVRATLTQKARLRSRLNLAAWATALVAVDGIDGIRRLETLYLSSAARHGEEVEAVAQALSVHARAEPALREPVVEAYRRILEKHPNMASNLVHDLIAWQRWDFAKRVEQVRANLDADPLAAYALGLYLRLAQGEQAFDISPIASGARAPRASDQPAEAEAR